MDRVNRINFRIIDWDSYPFLNCQNIFFMGGYVWEQPLYSMKGHQVAMTDICSTFLCFIEMCKMLILEILENQDGAIYSDHVLKKFIWSLLLHASTQSKVQIDLTRNLCCHCSLHSRAYSPLLNIVKNKNIAKNDIKKKQLIKDGWSQRLYSKASGNY